MQRHQETITRKPLQEPGSRAITKEPLTQRLGSKLIKIKSEPLKRIPKINQGIKLPKTSLSFSPINNTATILYYVIFNHLPIYLRFN